MDFLININLLKGAKKKDSTGKSYNTQFTKSHRIFCFHPLTDKEKKAGLSLHIRGKQKFPVNKTHRVVINKAAEKIFLFIDITYFLSMSFTSIK